MEDIYLDLSDSTEMINFLSRWLAFSSGKIHSHADSFITDYDDGKVVQEVELANFVREFARGVFPVRYALDLHFNEGGSAEEWSKVEKAVSRSTAHLLSRFRKMSEVSTLNELFQHDDFDITFGEERRVEIEQVRHHVLEDYWAANKNSLQSMVDDGEVVLNKFENIIQKMRDCAAGLPTLLQEELYSKITRFEDRVYYQGEVVPLQMLEEELAYYQDQKELPIEK